MPYIVAESMTVLHCRISFAVEDSSHELWLGGFAVTAVLDHYRCQTHTQSDVHSFRLKQY